MALAIMASVTAFNLAACGGSIRRLPVTFADDLPAPAADSLAPLATSLLEVQYLGSGGVLLRRGGDAILTAPFFSNPGLAGGLSLHGIAANDAVIQRLLPRLRGPDQVRAILVGHSHYDHLMDVPAVHGWLVEQDTSGRGHIPILLNRTGAMILGTLDVEPSAVEVVNERAGGSDRSGEWITIPGSPVRILALRSGHAPHALGIKAYGGVLSAPPARPPRRAADWKEGQTYAFLIDFLDDDGSTALRVHYQDAASTPPEGLPPPLPPPADRRVDLAITCVAGFSKVDGYPEAMVQYLAPDHVLLAHWENFFRPWEAALRQAPFTRVNRFIARLEAVLPEGGTWSLPAPGVTLSFRRLAGSGRWARASDSEQVAGHEQEIGGALGQPPHEPGKP